MRSLKMQGPPYLQEVIDGLLNARSCFWKNLKSTDALKHKDNGCQGDYWT